MQYIGEVARSDGGVEYTNSIDSLQSETFRNGHLVWTRSLVFYFVNSIIVPVAIAVVWVIMGDIVFLYCTLTLMIACEPFKLAFFTISLIADSFSDFLDNPPMSPNT